MVKVTIDLDEKENRAVGIHKAKFDLSSKEDAIKDIIKRGVESE